MTDDVIANLRSGDLVILPEATFLVHRVSAATASNVLVYDDGFAWQEYDLGRFGWFGGRLPEPGERFSFDNRQEAVMKGVFRYRSAEAKVRVKGDKFLHSVTLFTLVEGDRSVWHAYNAGQEWLVTMDGAWVVPASGSLPKRAW